MKTRILNFRDQCWQILTEVPGWPDAPRQVRLRRALPILVPCAAILCLLGWNWFVRDPQIGAERAAHQALEAQDNELETLRLACSEKDAADLAARAASVANLTVKDPSELAVVLQGLRKKANDRHWDGVFQGSDLSGETPPVNSLVNFLPARAKLTTANPEAFSSLLSLFEQFSESEKRIDLTRMGIRADEQGRYTVELALRLVGQSPNEKTPQ